jgi:hypothetical protein
MKDMTFGSNLVSKLLSGSRAPGDTRGLGFSSPITDFKNDVGGMYDNAIQPGYTRSQWDGKINTQYGNFVPGGYARPSGSQDTTNSVYDPFTPEVPDFSVGNSMGTQTEPRDDFKTIEKPTFKTTGSSANAGLFPTSRMSGPVRSNIDLNPQIGDFGASAARSGISAASPQTMSGGGGGLDLATGIAQKINAVGQAGASAWQQEDENAIDRQFMADSIKPGMHSQLHAGMNRMGRMNDLNSAKKWSELGGQIFGIPGMFGGYALAKLLGGGKNAPDLNTAWGAHGKINPQKSDVVNTMSDRSSQTEPSKPAEPDRHGVPPGYDVIEPRLLPPSGNGVGGGGRFGTGDTPKQLMGADTMNTYMANDTEYGNEALGDDAMLPVGNTQVTADSGPEWDPTFDYGVPNDDTRNNEQ